MPELLQFTNATEIQIPVQTSRHARFVMTAANRSKNHLPYYYRQSKMKFGTQSNDFTEVELRETRFRWDCCQMHVNNEERQSSLTHHKQDAGTEVLN